MDEVSFKGEHLFSDFEKVFNGSIRMFTGSLNEEVKQLEEEIEAVKDKVEDPIICEKIRQFVYAPREIQDAYKAESG